MKKLNANDPKVHVELARINALPEAQRKKGLAALTNQVTAAQDS
jgi:hypothetical protein